MATRRRPPFRDHTTVNVRCPWCGKAMAEAWADDTPDTFAHGRHSVHYVKPPERDRPIVTDGADLYSVDNPSWKCQRCKAVHQVDNLELHAAISAATARGERDVTLATS